MTRPTAGPSASGPTPRRVVVIGAGWAGLAAAVEARVRGHAVTLIEMAPQLGGRARTLPGDAAGVALDNGQHILLGAYADTLGLMKRVGVDPEKALLRRPLALRDARGRGLALPPGPPLAAFVRGVLGARGWTLHERAALLRAAATWRWRDFRCDASLSVAELAAELPLALRRGLIEPLCVAALNTPAAQASATVFLRVLRDALFGGPGASDLLLPRTDLGRLLPDAAASWLESHGASVQRGTRVTALARDAARWRVDLGDGSARACEAVVMACSAAEAARLAAPVAPGWAATAQALRHEPIVTVLLRAPGTRLPEPMLALDTRAEAPAQYVFDLGQLRDPAREPQAAGLLAFVVSGAADCVERGLEWTTTRVRAQARAELGHVLEGGTRADLPLVRALAEKRATFLCTPGLERPPAEVSSGLLAAGDYVDGPYPATLEGAVRSGRAAARAL